MRFLILTLLVCGCAVNVAQESSPEEITHQVNNPNMDYPAPDDSSMGCLSKGSYYGKVFVPAACDPYYFEKGRPPDDGMKEIELEKVNPNPEQFVGVADAVHY